MIIKSFVARYWLLLEHPLTRLAPTKFTLSNFQRRLPLVNKRFDALSVPRERRASGLVNPITLDTAWYRQFSGVSNLARGKNSL
jgi:hypothetical protein